MNKYLSLIFLCLFLSGMYIYPNTIWVAFTISLLIVIQNINKKYSYFYILLIINQFIFNHIFHTDIIINIILILLITLVSLLKKNKLTSVLFCAIISFLYYVFVNEKSNYNDVGKYIVYSVSGALVTYLLLINIDSTYKYTSYFAFELILAVFISLNASLLNINLFIVISSYFILYFSKNKKYLLSSIYLCIFTIYNLYILQNNYFTILLFVGLLSLIKRYINIAVLIIFVSLNFYYNFIDVKLSLYTSLVILVFEIFNDILVFNNNIDAMQIHDKEKEIFTSKTLEFASFLELYAKKYPQNKSFLINLNMSVNRIISGNCINCGNKNNCEIYMKKKTQIFKDLIIFNDRKDIFDSTLKEKCIRFYDISKLAKALNEKYNIDELYKTNNRLMFGLLEVSNFLKKYVIDTNTKVSIDYNKLVNIRYRLIDYGLNVVNYDVIKMFKEELEIDIVLLNHSYKDIISKVEKAFLEDGIEVSVLYEKHKINKLYIRVVSKININTLVAISKLKNATYEASGDNYFYKDKMMKAYFLLCDGMGKGDSAYNQSFELINMMKVMINTFETPDMVIDGCSSLIRLRNYQDKFSTLDFLEINKSSKKCKLYKCMSATTYHVKANEIVRYVNTNLPIGVDEENNCIEFSVKKDDIILLGTDGVFDNIKDESSLLNYINEIRSQETQKIANDIIKYILKSNKISSDDMIVMVIKIISA